MTPANGCRSEFLFALDLMSPRAAPCKSLIRGRGGNFAAFRYFVCTDDVFIKHFTREQTEELIEKFVGGT